MTLEQLTDEVRDLYDIIMSANETKQIYFSINPLFDVKQPKQSTKFAACWDFFVPNNFNNGQDYELKSNERIAIQSGISIAIPKYTALIAKNKSSISFAGIKTFAEVVDSDYTGEISLCVHNIDTNSFIIKPGMALLQFMLITYVNCNMTLTDNESLSNARLQLHDNTQSVRGDKAFGAMTSQY